MDIGASFNRAWEGFFGFLPNLLGFILLVVIGYVVAKVVGKAVQKLLEKAGLDRKLHESDANRYVETVMAGAKPSRGIGRVVFWLILAFFVFTAVGALGIPALTVFMNDVLAYLPNIIAAIVIFVVAAVLAGAVAAGVTRVMGDTPTGKIVASILPALVMVIAMFMILEQLKIAEEIVRIAFAATMGALALGLALAFGLGGRPVAQRMLEDAYRKGQEHKDQVKHDFATGRDRAEQDAHSVRASAGGSSYDAGYGSGSTHGSGSTYGSSSTYGSTDPGYDDPARTQQWSAPEGNPDQRF